MNKKFLIGVLLVVVAVVAVSCRGKGDTRLGELLDDNTYIVRDTISIDTVLHTIIIRESLMYSMTREEMISRRDKAVLGVDLALEKSNYYLADFYISLANSYGEKLGLPLVERY